MRVYVERASAFDRYPRGENPSAKIAADGGGGRHHVGAIHLRGSPHSMLPDLCYMCIDMARDTPGSPMPRPRDLGAGGGGAAAATLTSGAYHAATTDSASLHDHELQQKMLKVTYGMCTPRAERMSLVVETRGRRKLGEKGEGRV